MQEVLYGRKHPQKSCYLDYLGEKTRQWPLSRLKQNSKIEGEGFVINLPMFSTTNPFHYMIFSVF